MWCLSVMDVGVGHTIPTNNYIELCHFLKLFSVSTWLCRFRCLFRASYIPIKYIWSNLFLFFFALICFCLQDIDYDPHLVPKALQIVERMTLELPQLINIACLVQMALELPNITSHGGDAYAESNLDLGVKFNLTLEIYTLIYYDAYFGCSL